MWNKSMFGLRTGILVLASLCFLGASAHAQYFGQNKVRYKSLDFKVLKTEHFDIYYYDESGPVVADVGRMAERWYARLKTVLDHELSSRQPIVLYANHTDFRGTSVLPDYIGETTGGVTEGLRRRIVMPLAGPLGDTDHVLGHELVHAFQFDMTTREGPMGGSGLPGSLRFPLWFVEGMAEYLSVGSKDPHTAMWMRDAVLQDKLPTIDKLDDPDYFPYRWGQAFWAYVAGKHGDEVIGRILRAAGRAGTAEGAISSTLQTSLQQLSQEWHEALRSSYTPVLQAARAATYQARLLMGGDKKSGDIYVSPVLSPDGRNVVFFSEKDVFSIDLFMADAETGKMRRKLTQTALDGHFDSLQFINAAGAWSHDGRQFAFGEVRKGRPEIAIYDMAAGKVVKRHPISEASDIFSLAWSPDGSSIAFSAMANGRVDLFILDLPVSRPRRLTDDGFAELLPAWSPDGKSIAVSTDRFTSNASDLSFGELRLALIDPASSEMRPLPGFPSGKHLGAQWSADGSSLYFISDRDGVSNVYRLILSSGELRQITNLQTGVTGISKWSPAFSLAARASRLVFSSYSGDKYALYVMEGPAALEGSAPGTAVAGLNAGTLPPSQRISPIVDSLLRAPEKGIVGSSDFQREPYNPKLSLDYIAPPSVSVGVSNFGSMIGGGTAFYWSDILGQHNLMTAFQTSTTIDGGKFYNSLAGIASYLNQKNRWDWGFTGGQIPYLTGGYSRSLIYVGGEPVIVDESVRYWEINRQIAATAARPFSRAQRMEFSAGFANISYDAEGMVQAFSAVTGEYLGGQEFSPAVPDPINLGTGNAALVYDTSIFGGTGPILGRRYRLEFGMAGGTLNFSTLLVDYRRYMKIAGPLSLAARVMHYGRYGWDSEDPRMTELFIGYPSLVRGYEADSFSPDECTLSSGGSVSCPTLDRLFGSRMLVGNAELRLPIFGFLGVIPSRGAPPVDAAFFYDAGMAYRSKELARSLGVPRRPVSSYGASLRFNVLGFFIGQLSYVHANDRPQRRWGWEFSIIPGF